jgi:hypothetical protein
MQRDSLENSRGYGRNERFGKSPKGRLDPPRRFAQNRFCPVDSHGFQRPFPDPCEDEPLLFALAVKLLTEERVSRYHRLCSLCPTLGNIPVAVGVFALAQTAGGSNV